MITMFMFQSCFILCIVITSVAIMEVMGLTSSWGTAV